MGNVFEEELVEAYFFVQLVQGAPLKLNLLHCFQNNYIKLLQLMLLKQIPA